MKAIGDEVSVHFSKRFWDFASRQAGTADANGGLRPVRGAREPASGAWGLCHQQAGRCTHLPLLTTIVKSAEEPVYYIDTSLR